MTLQQLEYFLATARHGSFSSAAAELHLAQPSVSEQIRKLEAELGVTLFTRAGRRLTLTEAGRLLQPHAQRTLHEAEEALASVREVRGLRGGTAAFGTFGAAPSDLLADLVMDFRTRHPSVRVRILGQNSSEVADAVREGRLEAAIVVLPVDDRGLYVRRAIEDETFYLSADPARTREPITIEMLARRPLILYDARYGSDDPTRRQIVDRAQKAGVTVEPQIEVEYVEAALELCRRGLGDTIAARALALGRMRARRLHAAPFDPPLVDTFAFITRRNAHLSPATRAFMELAERRVYALARRE